MIRFGVHCSLRNGLPGALDEAHALGCEAVQLFARSPRMWRMRQHTPDEIAAFRRRRAETGIDPVVVHTPYLPNLATAVEPLYRRSVDSLQEDLVVMEQLAADFLVIHPGSFSLDSTRETGIARICAAINDAVAAVPGSAMVLLENVAGGGRRIGSSFAEIAALVRGIREQRRVGVCLDTAHALAAGYDLATPAGIDAMLAEFDREIGLGRLMMLHFNDSLVPAGSHKDRHEHLGRGHIGAAGFQYLVQRVKGLVRAGILETPKDTPAADRRNLSLLFRWRSSDVR
jgi:deoxyribonuclease-4